MADLNTKLLLHFDGDFLDYSGNNHHPNTNGHFSFTAGKFNTGFKTNAGKLEILSHPDFDLNSDFTIDAWCKLSSSGSTYRYLFSNESRNMALCFRPVYRRIYLYINNYSSYSANDVFPLDQWFHFALVKSGSSYTCYVNGESVYTRTSTDTVTNGTLDIGSYNSSDYLDNLDEFRFSDIARWNSNFTPPDTAYTSAEVTPTIIDDSPDFLLHFNDTFNATTGQRPILNGCFGFEDGVFDKAIRFNYGNLTFENIDAIKLGSDDFTIDFWAKFESTSSYFIFDNGAS